MKYRKYTWIVVFVFVASLILSACQTPPAEDSTEDMDPGSYEGELIISVWGGTTEEWFREQVEPVFLEDYPNVTVIYDVGGMSDRYNKLLAQKETPEIDLFVSTSEALVSAINENLVVPINADNIPNLEYLYDWATPLPEYGAAYGAIVYGLGYNPDYFGDNPPTSWNDLWGEDLLGLVEVPAIGHSMMPQFIQTAAELNGGSQENIDPGFEYLAELRPGSQTFFYTGWNAQFDSEDIVLAVDFDYYIQGMKDTGSNIEWLMPVEGGWGTHQHLSIAAGTENQAMVEHFINIALSKDVQQSVAEDLLNSPARSDIELSDELAARLTAYGDSLNDVRWMDPSLAAEMRPLWTEMMNEIVSPAWAE